MKAVLQRVKQASVKIDGRSVGEIDRGYVVFLGVSASDTRERADKLVNKISGLRIFPDAEGKTNLSAGDVGGQILVVSQFTLYADCRKGNRPSFTDAGPPALAEELYSYFVRACEGRFAKVAQGEFGGDMEVELINDGPFTLVLECDDGRGAV